MGEKNAADLAKQETLYEDVDELLGDAELSQNSCSSSSSAVQAHPSVRQR